MTLQVNHVLTDPHQKRILFWVLNTLFWGLLLAREYISYLWYLDPVGIEVFTPAIVLSIGCIITWPIRLFFIREISRIPSGTRLIILFFLAIVGFAILWNMVDLSVALLLGDEKQRNYLLVQNGFTDHLVKFSFFYLANYCIWGSLYLTFFFWEKFIRQTTKTQEAMLLASVAKLQMLQNQVNPHFLFNSLNSIRALVFENREKAAELITDLSDFLRFNLSQANQEFISLDKELTAIRKYLSIEKKRFEEDLVYSVEAGPDCSAYSVLPNLLLPLVDNAVKYGIQTGPVPLTIRITARKEEDSLRFEVFNTGAWYENGSTGAGKGIRNVRERLANVYSDRHQFEIEKNPGFVSIIIKIPANHATDLQGGHRG